MRREIDIEPRLSSWMERQARGAPDDLLPRVMREVGSMSQESRTVVAWLHPSSTAGWMTGGLAVMAVAIALGVFIANLRTAPAGVPSSPSPEATPSLAAGTILERDPVGDATGEAPDVVAVGIISVSDELFTLDIELDKPLVRGTLTVGLETDGAGPYPGPRPMTGPDQCNGWFMEEWISVDAAGTVVNTGAAGQWQPSPVLSGTHVILEIRPQELGVTGKLAFQVVTRGVDGAEHRDWFPDEADGCYPLIWDSQPGDEGDSASTTAAPSAVAETITVRDRTGDATVDAPDIVGVSTTVIPDDEVILKIELAKPMTYGTRVWVYLETNGAGPSAPGEGPLPLDDPEWCNPWFMEARVSVGSEGFASDTLTDVWNPGPMVADGTTLTLPIPLDTVAPDGFLTLFVRTTGTGEGEPWSDDVGQDRFPNDDNRCYPVMWPES